MRRDDEIELTLETPGRQPTRTESIARLRVQLRELLLSGEPEAQRRRAMENLDEEPLYAVEVPLALCAGRYERRWRELRRSAWAAKRAVG